MPKLLCSLYDNKAEEIVGNIIIVRHPAAAIRMFSDIAADEKPNGINNHLEDYDLYILGEVGDDTQLTLVGSLELLITGATLKAARGQAHEGT